MTVFTGTLTASSDQSGFEVIKATDGISGTGSRWAAANTSMPQTLTWDFGSAVVPKHYTVGPAIASTGQELTAWELRGSVSDATFATYDVLDSRSVSAASTTKRYALSNTTAYRYVRLHITASGGDVASTSDFQVSGGTTHKSFENVPATIATYADGTPASVTVHSDGTAYNMGQIFSSAVDGNITHLRYYEPSGLSGTVTLRLYGAAGAVLASTTHTAVSSSSGWRDVALSSPYAITAGTEYMAAMRLPGGWYARAGNGGTQGRDLWWGTIKHPAVGNATYGGASTQGRLGFDDAVPSGYYGNSTYAVGVVFEEPSSSIDLTSPTATATAAASAATVALSALLLTSPAASAAAAANPATVAVQALAVTSPAATATAAAAPSTLGFGPIDLVSPEAAATAAAAPGTVSVGGLDLTSPQAAATAAAGPATLAMGALPLTSPAATATAAALPAAVGIGGALSLISPTAIAHAAASPAYVDGVDLGGWTADLTGRALIGVATTPIDLYVPGAVVTPPAGVTVHPVVRNSHQMPALTAAKRRYREDEYPILDSASLGEEAIVGTWHVWVDGVDRTYDDDGELLDVDDLVAEKGFGDRTARVDVKHMQLWHESGTGDYAWLRPGAKVEAGIVHPDGTRKILFAGDLISETADSTAGASPTFAVSWTAQGTLVQAMQATMQPLDEMPPTQTGVVVPRVMNSITSRRFPKIPTLPTPGVETRKLGSYGQKVGDFVKAQLAMAWDGESQLALAALGADRRQYSPAWTDTVTIDWTLTAGAQGVAAKLDADWSQVVNCYYGRGTLPNGHRWMNRRFPYMLPYAPPTYFSGDTSAVLSLGSTDAGTINNGVSLLQRRLQEIGYREVRVTGVYDLVTLSAVRRLQTTRGLTVDGIVGGQTWTSVWSIGATGADLRSVRLPLWVDPRVEPWLYLPNGAIAEPNPEYDVNWPRIEEDIDYGDNTTLAVGVADATQRGERTKEPGLVGKITIESDFWEGSRFLADPMQNVELLGWRGQDPVLHIVQRHIKRKAGIVELTVDSKFRDALTIRQVIARDAESKADPARRPGAIGRTSSTTVQDFSLFDGDSAAGIIPELTLRNNKWSVWPFPLDRVGTLARVWARTYDPVTRFVLLLFGREVLPSQLHANLGNALTSTRPWSDPAIDAWLTRMGFITGYGQEGEACGFYPGSEQDGDPLTGVFETHQPANFVSQVKGFAWAAVLPEDDCRFEAECEPQAKG